MVGANQEAVELNAAFSTSTSVALHSGDRVYGQVILNAGSLNVAPYVVLGCGPGGLLASEVVNLAPTTARYGYDLVGMGRLPQRVVEFSGTTPTTSYFYGVGTDRPLDVIQGGVPYYYQRDDLGSTTTVTDASGDVVASYAYDAYGNLRQAMDTISNPLRYTGLAYDTTTSLVYARAREYDPTTGTFLTPDPVACGRRPSCGCQSESAYGYAADNPVNRVDPTGRFVNMGPLFDGSSGDVNNDLAAGVGLNGPRWEIWANPTLSPEAAKMLTDWTCGAIWGVIGLEACALAGPLAIGCAVFMAVVGGAACAAVDAYFFHKPFDLVGTSCQDVAGEMCSQAFNQEGLGFLGAIACPLFASAYCSVFGGTG